MWFDQLFKPRKKEKLIPPAGLGRNDIAVQSSICTGETLVGFLDKNTGRLLRAVVVKNGTDLAEFYRSYGYEPPRHNG